MKMTVSQYVHMLQSISSKKSGSEQKSIAQGFFRLLMRKGELKKLPHILRGLQHSHDSKIGKQAVVATTAFPADEKTVHMIEKLSKEVFESKSATVEMKTDEKIVGGVILRTENEMIDLSIRKRFGEFKKVLLKK